LSFAVEVKSDYRSVAEVLESGLEGLLRRFAEKAVESAQSRAPKRTGYLASQISSVVEGGSATIYAKAPYSAYVEFGTRPHPILPKRAKALRFEVDGEVVFARRVHHPGTQPQPFLFQAVYEAIPDLVDGLRRLVEGSK
jgi:HK97 gp10 family phage protein